MDYLSYIIQFWELAVIALVIILELLARWLDSDNRAKINFNYGKMPVLQPVKIPTNGRGVLSAIWVWIGKPRKWIVAEDFCYSINGVRYVIPAGFEFDGASVPKFLHTLLSPTGILLLGGLVHDYGYRYQCLQLADGRHDSKHSQKHFDKIFRDINIQVNGFKTINYVSYFMLRVLGIFAWNKNEKKANNE